jgi:hypothetical protein
LRIIPISENGLLRTFIYERNFYAHTENLTYNSSSGLYEYTPYPYRAFPTSFIENISCMGQRTDNSTRSWFVSDTPPFITFQSIFFQPFTDNILIETPDEFQIIYNVLGVVVSSELNITNSAGVVLKTVTNTNSVTLNSSELLRSGYYNVSVWVMDDDGNTSYNVTKFRTNDTTNPALSITEPTNYTYNINGVSSVTVPITAVFSDVNLFAYEVYILKDNTSIVFYENLNNITTTSYAYTKNVLLNITGNYSIWVNVSDDHTDTLFPDLKTEIAGRSINFNFTKNINKLQLPDEQVKIYFLSGAELSTTSIKKLKDRYTFDFDFAGVNTGKGIMPLTEYTFRVYCQDQYFRPYSSYIGHSVCYSTKTWVDFSNKEIVSYKARECGLNCMEYAFLIPESKKLSFESIGGINTMSASREFEIINSSVPFGTSSQNLNDFICPSDVQGTLLLIFVFAVLLAFIILSVPLEIGFLGLFAAIGMFLLSFVVMDCHWWTGVIMSLCGLVLIMWFSLQKIF